jgi:GT2 family glycosyltransferase
VKAVLTLTHNNLALTKRCLASVRHQDIPTRILVLDNGSTDGTREWGREEMPEDFISFDSNRGVSVGWNAGLSILFALHDEVLVIGNDTVLPDGFYTTLLSYHVPFVTGIAVDNMQQAAQPPVRVLTPNPDFSAFLIRRYCWTAIGPFDESMKHYCSDCDMHVRAHRMGVPLMKSSTPFYHERSSTLRLAPPEERAEIEAQANMDRAVFYQKYGCLPGSERYKTLFY